MLKLKHLQASTICIVYCFSGVVILSVHYALSIEHCLCNRTTELIQG